MTVQQSAYGKPGDSSELVPGGLRVYRHYKIDAHGFLYPTTTAGNEPVQPGVNVAKCMISATPFGPRGKVTCPACYGRGYMIERKLVRSPSSEYADYLRLTDREPFISSHSYHERVEEYEVACPCVEASDCKAPNIECSCGFYASYSPQTDFFAGRGVSWWGVPPPPIFAVVEASGRVLMGSKGVRAEKMEVKALSVDLCHVGMTPDPSRAIRDAVRWAGYAATRYGVRSYSHQRHDMYGDFPQPDLSNLLKNQES